MSTEVSPTTKKILPPCTYACPVETDVRGIMAAITEKNLAKAEALIRQNNPFASVCAWICPQPCAESCRRRQVDSPLAVRALKRFALEAAQKNVADEKTFPPPKNTTGKRVAVIGAGPGGLTAAFDLAQEGHIVTVYEKSPVPGGHLAVSLPLYRLPAEIIQQDIRKILAAGVEIKTSVEIGKALSLEEITGNYDAVILAVGLQVSRNLPLPGFDHPGVFRALPFLQAVRHGETPLVGERVLVLGGGDVALDVARAAVRLKAREVCLVCLERQSELPAQEREITEASAEGVKIIPGRGPKQVIIADGKISGLEVKEVKTVFDVQGNFNPTFYEDRISLLSGDTIILAIGQQADLAFLAESNIQLDESGQIVIDKLSLTTNVPGIFACGEVAAGPGSAVAAVASGHQVASSVHHFLSNQPLSYKKIDEIEVIGKLSGAVITQIPRLERQEPPLREVSQRICDFTPYESVLSAAAALNEAFRCLNCGLGAEITGPCSLCLTCLRSCPYHVPLIDRSATIPRENCLACGICAAVCPAEAISLQRFPAEKVKNLLKTKADSPLVIFACRYSWTRETTPGDLIKEKGIPQSLVIKLPTISVLNLSWLLEAFESGARRVAVAACREECCLHPKCSFLTRKMVNRAKSLLEEIGLDPATLHYYEI